MSVSAPPSFQAELSRSGPTSMVALKGELDVDAEPKLRRAVADALTSDPLIVVLDLRELTFIDSNGIFGLIKTGRTCQARGRRFFLIRARPHIDRLLTLSGVNGPFDIISDLDHLEDGSLTVVR